MVVPRKGDVDRNLFAILVNRTIITSSPARGTWIEMPLRASACFFACVVPRKGDVDRNADTLHVTTQTVVVPRKGDVDRNEYAAEHRYSMIIVVPRKGDVDRNVESMLVCRSNERSSPARGTWIEIR